MTTQAKLDKYLAQLDKGADLGITFMYKSLPRSAVKITQKKGGVIIATFNQDGKDIDVCTTLDEIVLSPMVDDTWQVSRQKPKLKKETYVRIDTKNRKNVAPYLTADMRNFTGKICKVEEIDHRGFYKLRILEQSQYGHPESFSRYKWSDRWVKKLTKKECEEELVIKPFENLIQQFIKRDNGNINRLAEMAREQGQSFTSIIRNLDIALQKKNKTKDEIEKEKKAEFKESLKRLNKDTRINSVDITLSGITITTNPLEYRCVNLPILKEFTKQPAYEIHLDLQNGVARANICNHKNNPSEDEYVYVRSGSIHPHLSASGNPCLGNMATPFQTAMAKFDVSASAMVMLELLESYNTASPYQKLGTYYKKAVKCEKCGHHIVLSECENCGFAPEIDKEKYLMPFGK